MPRKTSTFYQWSIIFMCSMTVFLEYASRNNINNAIVSMVKSQENNHRDYGIDLSDTYYCPIISSDSSSFDSRNHSQVQMRGDNKTSNMKDKDDLLDWSPTTQGLVLGSFWYGYIILQVPAGRLSELFGGKWIVAIGLIVSGIINLITPSIVSSIPILITSRVFLGLIQGGILPACFSLIITWLPKDKRSLGFGLVNVGGNLGAVFAAAFTGYISQEYHWSYTFYLIGSLTLIWVFLIWITSVSDSPDQLTSDEVKRIVTHRSVSLASYTCNTSLGDTSSASSSVSSTSSGSSSDLSDVQSNSSLDKSSDSKCISRPRRVPWIAIFTNPVVLAAAAARFTGTFGYLTLQTKLPAYLVDMLHVPPSTNGFLNSFLFIAVSLSMALGPYVSEILISKHIFTRTTVRKIFSSIALYTLAICLLIVPMIDCNTNLIIATLVIGMFAYGFVTGGDVIVPAEISIHYPSTIYSSLNSFSSLSGSLAPLIVGFILENSITDADIVESLALGMPISSQLAMKQSWDTVFYLTAFIVALGTTIFIMYGSSERQAFDFTVDEVAEENNKQQRQINEKQSVQSIIIKC